MTDGISMANIARLRVHHKAARRPAAFTALAWTPCPAHITPPDA